MPPPINKKYHLEITVASIAVVALVICLSIDLTQKNKNQWTSTSSAGAMSGAGSEGRSGRSMCADPLAAVLATLDCIVAGDAACAAEGYDAAFSKLHNGVEVDNVGLDDVTYWENAFALVELGLDINHQLNIGANMASIRYTETVTTTDGLLFGLPGSSDYPFGQVFLQHEHALVTVNDDCKMVRWDQYGDNKEQTDVVDAATAILCALGVATCEE